MLLGAIAGWLTGKAADGERAGRGQPRQQPAARHYFWCHRRAGWPLLFFWVIIGSSSFGNYATAVLGAIAVVGAARLIGARATCSPHGRLDVSHL